MIGAGIGGIGGFYNGIKATNLAQQTGKLRRWIDQIFLLFYTKSYLNLKNFSERSSSIMWWNKAQPQQTPSDL